MINETEAVKPEQFQAAFLQFAFPNPEHRAGLTPQPETSKRKPKVPRKSEVPQQAPILIYLNFNL